MTRILFGRDYEAPRYALSWLETNYIEVNGEEAKVKVVHLQPMKTYMTVKLWLHSFLTFDPRWR
jgi:hypothetical protein